MLQESEFVLRRMTEQFTSWMIAIPVLFALTVLFVVSCLRQDKGIGTLLLGLCMLIVAPVFMSYDHKVHGGRYEAELAVKIGVVGLIVAGFVMNLLREFGAPWALAGIGGGLALLLHLGWVFFEESLKASLAAQGIEESLPFVIAPYVLLFMVQCGISLARAGLWLGLAAIAVLSAIYLPFAYNLKPHLSWWVVIVPVLAIALFYVGMMYIRDAKTIHPIWAGFLGLLRCTVYAILAYVFVLPGRQFFETTEVPPKVLVLFDVSGSMNWKDELASPGQVDARLTRQEKVLQFLTAPQGPGGDMRDPWMARLLQKSPATVYRFGRKLDDLTVQKLIMKLDVRKQFEGKKDEDIAWTMDDWKKFLHPSPDQVKLTDFDKEKLFTTEKDREEEIARRERLLSELVNGTDVPESANQMAKMEAANYVQAIVIISDGRTNSGSEQSLREFLARVNNPDRKIHVFTIGVGDYKQPVEIKIEAIQAPQVTRPDEKIPLRVPVLASKGLRNEKFKMVLEATRVRDRQKNALYPTWWSRRTAPVFQYAPKEGTFVGEGEFPQATLDYEIDLIRLFQMREKKLVRDIIPDADKLDPAELEKQLRSSETEFMRNALEKSGVDTSMLKIEAVKGEFMERFLEGTWEFTARVPKHPQEVFDEDDHMSRPPHFIDVQNKKLRILLFAAGPTRDYQFCRTLLSREAQAKRIELSVYLQSGARAEGVDQDVPAERMLGHFPHRRGPDDPKDKFSSINVYDLIIAFDPDWSALDANLPDQSDLSKKISNADQARLVSNWVSREGGGIIFVAGPVNTYMLSAATPPLGDLPKMVPVSLKDYRLSPDLGVDMRRPWPLTFTPAAQTVDFLKLDLTGDKKEAPNPLAGWEKFFWGDAGRPTLAGQEPVRGIYGFYPVEAKRNDTMVLATFAGPKETRLPGGIEETPWLATMRYGSGKTIYIGSSETWRLRQYKESYHEMFWLSLARAATTGSQNQEKFGRWVAATKAMTGTIPVEIQIKEAVAMKGEGDGEAEKLVAGGYLPREGAFRPKIYLRKQGEDKDIEVFDLRPKASDGPWLGWFEGKVKIKKEGDYVLINKIFAPSHKQPLTTEVLEHRLRIDEAKLEDANVREDFDALRDLATDAEGIVERVRSDIEDYLPARSKFSTEGRKLFFPLARADKVPDYLLKLEPRKVRGLAGIVDEWDKKETLPLFHILWSVPLFLFALAGAIMMFHEKWIMGTISLILAAVVPLTVLILPWIGQTTGLYSGPEWENINVDYTFVLVGAISLLGIEWLTRKLLKLA